MASSKELIDYIRQSLEDGRSQSAIRKDLLANGWTEADVDDGFQAAAADRPVLDASDAPAVADYSLRQAARDTWVAIKRNWRAVIGVMGLALLMTAVLQLLIATLFIYVIRSHPDPITAASFIVLPAAIGIGLIVLTSIALTITVDDGASGKASRLGQVIRLAWQRFGRVLLVNLLLGVIIMGPLLIAMIAVMVNAWQSGGWLQSGGSQNGVVNASIFVLAAISIAWAILASIRFALATYVAILEPEVPIKQILSRSVDLIRGIGQLFVLKLIGLLILFSILLSAFTGDNSLGMHSGYAQQANPLANIFGGLGSLFASAMLVLLYRNRRKIKR